MAGKKRIDVTLHIREIIFDIENKTHIVGHSREMEDGSRYAAASNMQASDDDDSSYQMKRSISNAIGNLKTELAEYLDEESTATNNRIIASVDAEEDVTLSLSMPSNYNQASADNLGAGLHQYVVNMAIYDWFVMTNKADAGDYGALSAAALETARRALYKRTRPMRPVY